MDTKINSHYLIIISSSLCLAFLLFTLALFSNNWGSITSKTETVRIGFYEKCTKGRGCQANDAGDASALSLSVIGYSFLATALLFALFILIFRNKIEETFEAKLIYAVMFFQVISTLFIIAGFARFTETSKDLASDFTKTGESYYLALVSFALSIFSLTFTALSNAGLIKFNYKKFMPIGVVLMLVIIFVVYNVGLFTNSWVVSTDKSPIAIKNGFYYSCARGICVQNIRNQALTLEIIGFVFLANATLISIVTEVYDSILGVTVKKLLWYALFSFEFISLVFIVSGWARFSTYLVVKPLFYNLDWSFYIVILVLLFIINSLVLVVWRLKKFIPKVNNSSVTFKA